MPEEKKPECYHCPAMYSASSCEKCPHTMDCYEHFLNYFYKRRPKTIW